MPLIPETRHLKPDSFHLSSVLRHLSSDLKLAGHTTSPTMVDWDGDSLPDLLIGAEDGHFYYLKNNSAHQ